MHARITPGGLAIISILAACLVALLLRGQSDIPVSGVPAAGSLDLAPGEIHQITIDVGAVTPKLRLRAQSTGSATFTIGEEQQTCQADECLLIFNPVTSETTVVLMISAETATSITDIGVSLVHYRLNTTLGDFTPDQWGIILALLVGAIAINTLFTAYQRAMQWMICLLTIAFLLANDAVFTISLVAYLSIIFLLRNLVTPARNGYLISALLTTSIAFLLLFKYANQVVWEIFANPGGLNLLMPVGISYFVIRILDTQLRWYRREATDITFREFLLFIIFPGTLIAGPIEDIRHFYSNRIARLTSNDFAYGLARILVGIFKKIVIADAFLLTFLQGTRSINFFGQPLSVAADTLATLPMTAQGPEIFIFAFVGLTYAYVDFSAYSDMAIGVSRLFGYRIRENFNFPLLAPNLREYWKRWHISLSDWSFRNIYFPALIKSQSSYLPLYLTMLTIGMWHAFSLSWFTWALHHATGMNLVGACQKHLKISALWLTLLRPVRTALTLVYVSLGFIFVYFSDYGIAVTLYWRYLQWLFSWAGLS